MCFGVRGVRNHFNDASTVFDKALVLPAKEVVVLVLAFVLDVSEVVVALPLFVFTQSPKEFHVYVRVTKN